MDGLKPTREELARESFGEAHLHAAVTALGETGFIVIKDVVDHDHLDTLRVQMEKDLKKIQSLSVVPHNFVWGNIQQHPPPYAKYIFRDVVANPFACQITRSVLGAGAYINGVTGNSNVPGSTIQPVHVDDGQLWPGLAVAPPASRLAVNLALGDTTAENGAIELWPGTHLDLRQVIGQDIRVDESAVEERRKTVPPVLGETTKGSVLIRDMRLWHRGMPNAGTETRFMIAMVHNVSWLRRKGGYRLQRGCEDVFEGCEIENEIPIVDDPGEDHIRRNKPYAYDGPN